MNYKEQFEKIFKENIKREGADKLLDWLEKSDFFTAPASTKFHMRAGFASTALRFITDI